MNHTKTFLSLLAGLWLCCSTAAAADAFLQLRFTTMKFSEGALPTTSETAHLRDWSVLPTLEPYAVLEGDAEAYVMGGDVESWATSTTPFHDMVLFVRCPKSGETTGRLFLAKPDLTGMVQLKFKVDPAAAAVVTEKQFLTAKEAHYRDRSLRNIPGGAWFRHQERMAAKARGDKPMERPDNLARFNRARPLDNPEDAYDLFSGGRAISENLQLDRVLAPAKAGERKVAVSNITGITVSAMDWKSLLQGAKPVLDPLANFIPSDQHALFFLSFSAVSELMDEADAGVTPVLHLMEPRAEDANSRGRYQKQLCLELNAMSRLLGPQVISSVAVTGSDPYLVTGTDVGVLFETKSPGLLKTFIQGHQAAAKQSNSSVKAVSGELEGVAYSGVVSPDRAVSSYVAALDEAVLVSNSTYQLGRLIQVAKGKSPALATQDEYTFFRNRYARGGNKETALLVLSDATIRRWCGPQWRISDARRTRAAAVLAELQATHLEALVKGQIKPGPLQLDLPLPELGELTLTSAGVASSVYGTLEFLTPIGELSLTQVSQEEASAYGTWRDGYQANWRQYFDPIAVRFSVQPRQLGAELTVMPLITGTEYRDIISLTRGAKIAPGSGDPHPEALLHLALSIDAQSTMARQAGTIFGSANSTLSATPLSWLGQSIAIYADQDPFWDKLAQAPSASEFLLGNYSQLPVALHCEAKSAMALTAFLAALRGYIEQTAPKMTRWVNAEHQGQAYVKVSAAGELAREEGLAQLAIYYAVTAKSLMVTPSETLLKRALERQAVRASNAPPDLTATAPAKAWLGTNLCLQVDKRLMTALEAVSRDGYRSAQQLLSWSNLPILNEWKRRFPSEDPVKLHERLWKTKLICPSGGGYVWNEEWRTMESTVYGHPGQPKKGPENIGALARITSANLGLTFEPQGLSARAVLERESK